MQSTGPLTSDPVLLTDLAKGDLFFIRLPNVIDAQLAVLISAPTANPIRAKYISYNYGRTEYFYQSEVPDLETFSVFPPDYTNPRVIKIREQLFPRRLGGPVDEDEVLRRGLGKLYYFKEGDGLYVLGRLVEMRISQFDDIRLTYREMPSEDFPEGQPHAKNYSPGYLDPYIFEYRQPPPSRQNILRQGRAIMERNGPEGGMKTIMHHMGKAAMHERMPLLSLWHKTQKRLYNEGLARFTAEEAAAGGGGGGAANNTTKGGVRRTGRFPAKRRRRYTKRK